MNENGWQCVDATGYAHKAGRVATFAGSSGGVVLTVRNDRDSASADGSVKLTRNEARALLRNLWILIDNTDTERL